MVAGGCGVVVTAAVEVPAAVEVVARALGFGHAAAEAVGLGRKHEAAARGAVPVAGAAGRSGALAVAAAAAPAAAEAAIAALLIVLAPGAGWGGRQRGDVWDNGTSFGTFFRASARRLFVARRNRVRGERSGERASHRVAGALGFGHAAAEAVGLGREHVSASVGARPVARPHVGEASASGTSSTAATSPGSAVGVAPVAPAVVETAALVEAALVKAALVAPAAAVVVSHAANS